MEVAFDTPPTLRHVQVGIRPIIDCTPSISANNPGGIKSFSFYINAKDKICAGYPLQRTDQGDSGGPLLYRRNNTIYQIGLTESGFFSGKDVVKLSKFLC